MPLMTVPFSLFIGVVLPPGIGIRLFSSLLPLAALNSTSPMGNASYLLHFASKGKFTKLPTSMLIPITLIMLIFSTVFPNLPIFTPLMTFWLVTGMPIRTLSVIAVPLPPSNFSKPGPTCFRCLLRLRMLPLQVLMPLTTLSIRSTVTISLCTLVWITFL